MTLKGPRKAISWLKDLQADPLSCSHFRPKWSVKGKLLDAVAVHFASSHNGGNALVYLQVEDVKKLVLEGPGRR